VLLVEDTPDNQILISLFLRRMGLDVTLVDHGAAALELAASKTFDVILMDMHMPVMDGIDATRRLRAAGYRGAIVALTANAMREDRDRCREAGCDDFLTKPIDRADLNTVLARYLDAAAPTPQRPPIHSTLLQDEPDLADLVDQFIRRLPEYLDKLTTAAERKDYAALKDYAHQLTGVGGNYGYAMVSELASRLQFQAVAGNAHEIGLILEEFADVYDRIVAGRPESIRDVV
jgi:CheY-like chemotaxis protein/HPt (histidine-containing phosphotransfer) domain-containing protein